MVELGPRGVGDGRGGALTLRLGTWEGRGKPWNRGGGGPAATAVLRFSLTDSPEWLIYLQTQRSFCRRRGLAG